MGADAPLVRVPWGRPEVPLGPAPHGSQVPGELVRLDRVADQRLVLVACRVMVVSGGGTRQGLESYGLPSRSMMTIGLRVYSQRDWWWYVGLLSFLSPSSLAPLSVAWWSPLPWHHRDCPCANTGDAYTPVRFTREACLVMLLFYTSWSRGYPHESVLQPGNGGILASLEKRREVLCQSDTKDPIERG